MAWHIGLIYQVARNMGIDDNPNGVNLVVLCSKHQEGMS
jgi:hypothetical protein